MKYASKPSTAHAQAHVPSVIESLDKLGLAESVMDVRELIAHAHQLNKTARHAASDTAGRRQDLVRQLSSGTIGHVEAAERAIDLERLGAVDGAGVALLKDAATLTFNRASAALAEHGDALITDLLGPLAERTVTDAAKAAAVLPEWCDSDAEAIKGERVVREAWATLSACAATWDGLCSFSHSLRTGGYAPVPRVAFDAPAAWFLYRHPELLVQWNRDPAPPVIFAADIAAGAEPAMITGAEVAAIVEARQAEENADVERRRFAARRYSSAPNREAVRDAAEQAVAQEGRRNPVIQFFPDPGGAA